MSETKIVIFPTADEQQLCESIHSHLQTFWTEPEQFTLESLAVVENHVQTCQKCGARFLELAQQVKPPWEKPDTHEYE